ncbi:hypothetical protein LMCDFJHI_02542 [Aeromonas salmonicida]
MLRLFQVVVRLAQLVVGIAQATCPFHHLAFQQFVELNDLSLNLLQAGDVITESDQILEIGAFVKGGEGPLQHQLIALLVMHDDLFVLNGAMIGQGQSQVFPLLLADKQIQPVVLQYFLLVIAGQQYGRRVDAGDVEIRLHATDDHVGRVDQRCREVPLLLQLFCRLMARRKLIVQPCSHLVEGRARS